MSNELAIIPLRRRDSTLRAFAWVSKEDYGRAIVMGPWHINSRGYVLSNRVGSLHRFVLGLTDPTIGVDHIDRDRLNNCRTNLRQATQALNMQNTGSRPGASSSYRGVCWCRTTKKWCAQAGLGGRTYRIGDFDHELDAARAAAAWRAEHMPFSDEARLAALGEVPE